MGFLRTTRGRSFVGAQHLQEESTEGFEREGHGVGTISQGGRAMLSTAGL